MTSSLVKVLLRSVQQAMPSHNVPLRFHRGWPAVKVVSRCTCGSTYGADASAPRASMTALAGGSSPPADVTATNRPSSTCKSVSASGSAPTSRAPRTTRSITGLLQPQLRQPHSLAGRSLRWRRAEHRLRTCCWRVGITQTAGLHPPDPGVHDQGYYEPDHEGDVAALQPMRRGVTDEDRGVHERRRGRETDQQCDQCLPAGLQRC